VLRGGSVADPDHRHLPALERHRNGDVDDELVGPELPGQLAEQGVHRRKRHGENRDFGLRYRRSVVGRLDATRVRRPRRDRAARAFGIARSDNDALARHREPLRQPAPLLPGPAQYGDRREK
jgi:hypothetical protein